MQGIGSLLSGIAAACISFALTPVVRWISFRVGAVDHPDPRKIHTQPMPRLGGVAVVVAAGTLLTARYYGLGRVQPWTPPELYVGLAFGLLPILAVSIWDDIRAVPPLPKMLAQTLGAAIAISWGVVLQPTIHLLGYTVPLGAFAIPLSFIWLVGVTNAFNIVDGLDGLSAGLGLISSASLTAVFLLSGETDTAGATLILAGALVGFLPHNIHPARIFLGDNGATAIGFALACFALRGGATLSAGFAALLPVFVLGLPIADTLISIVRRMLGRFRTTAGAGVLEADRDHIHHRLLALGIDHRHAVFLLYGVGAIGAVGALASLLMTAQVAGLLLGSLLIGGFVGLRSLGYQEFAIVRSGLILKFYDAPVLKTRMFGVFIDIAVLAVGVYGAIALKYDDWTLAVHRTLALEMIGVTVPVSVALFWLGRLYRSSWRVAGLDDFVRASRVVGGAILAASVVTFLVSSPAASASVFGIFWLLSFMLIAGSRLSYQVLMLGKRRAVVQGVPTLIYGAGVSGVTAVQELLSSPDRGLRPVGFIDDDPDLTGKLLCGLPIVGSLDALKRTIARLSIQSVVVSSGRISNTQLERAMDVCGETGVKLVKMEMTLAAAGDAPSVAQSISAPSLVAEAPDAEIRRAEGEASPPGLRTSPCPSCRSVDLHRSHSLSLYERIYKVLTADRPFRCRACGWRGWLPILDYGAHHQGMISRRAGPDFVAIDDAVRRSATPRQSAP